jgi:phage tail-like protein
MKERQDRPYSQFNFLVTADQINAGFQEVTGLGLEVPVAEYRNGSEKETYVRKINGRAKVADITLKRGVIGKADLYTWIKSVQNGAMDSTALKTVTVTLKSEDLKDDAMTWVISNARPIKYTGPSLNGKGNDIAIEELVLACERIEIK